MRLVPFSYFWTCWNVIPSTAASFSWLIPEARRRARTRAYFSVKVFNSRSAFHGRIIRSHSLDMARTVSISTCSPNVRLLACAAKIREALGANEAART